MFHDDLLETPQKREQFLAAYNEMADAVHAALRMLNCVVKEVAVTAGNDGRENLVVPILMSYEFIDLIDGVELLVIQGAASNSAILLRSALELLLGVMYLVENPTELERRTRAYEYWNIRQKLMWVRRGDKDSEEGKRFASDLAGDDLTKGDATPFFEIAVKRKADVKAQATQLQAILQSASFAEVHAAHELAKKSGKKVRNWFSVLGGPADIRQLARLLKQQALYITLYDPWSSQTHGANALDRLCSRNGMAMFEPVRSPKGLPTAARLAASLSVTLCGTLVESFRPDLLDEMKRHFTRHVREKLVRIRNFNNLDQ